MLMMKISIMFILAGNQNCIGFLNRLANLRNKANKIKDDVKVITESSHGPSIKFNKRSEILYPGLDKNKGAVIQKLWKDYYECQQAFYESSLRLIIPDAVEFFESTNAKLECEVCESPRDMFLETVWLYSAEYNLDKIQNIRYNDNIFMKNDSLYINNIKCSQGGLYVCKKGDHFARPYILHVFDQETSKKVVPVENKDGEHEHPAEDFAMKGVDATLTTRWGEWTQCSQCDRVGKRMRQGICTIVSNKHIPGAQNETNLIRSKRSVVTESLETATENITMNSTATETTEPPYIICNTTEMPKLYEPQNTPQKSTNMSLHEDLELLEMFEDGIPCRSKLLSETMRSLGDVVNRSSEVMYAYCKVPCPKNVLFVVVDEKGNILETANNSDGVYSVLQGIPQTLPGVSRTVEFAYNKEYFKIQCPGNRNGDIPIEWYVGQRALTNKLLDSETRGRIKIDEYSRIIFNPVFYDDSRIYSCWQHDELVGTIRLIVEEKHKLNYQRSIMVIGTIVIFYTFGSVYYQVFSRTQLAS